MERGTVTDLTVRSGALAETVPLFVYLPPFYSEFKKYPLIIAQDGRDYFQLGRIAKTMDELIREKRMQPAIFAGVPYRDVHDRRGKYHPSGEKHATYLYFLAHELLPALEREFPVSPAGSSRALAGDSLAATVSLLAAMQYPRTFGNLLLHSPYVNGDVIERAKNFSEWPLLRIYHVVGRQETAVKTTDGAVADFLTPNRMLKEWIEGRPSEYFYEEFAGNHTWKYWQKDLKRGLSFLFPAE